MDSTLNKMTTQELRRCALALLLPLFMRCTNAAELCVSTFSVVVATHILVRFDGKSLSRDLVAPILISATWSLLACCIADYIVIGPWLRLFFTYLIALDGMGLLLPSSLFSDLPLELSFDVRCFTADVIQRVEVLGPFIQAAIVAYILLPYYNARSPVRLLLCIGVTFCTVVAQCQKIAALTIRHCNNLRRLVEQAAQSTEEEAANAEWKKKGIPEILVTSLHVEARVDQPPSSVEKGFNTEAAADHVLPGSDTQQLLRVNENQIKLEEMRRKKKLEKQATMRLQKEKKTNLSLRSDANEQPMTIFGADAAAKSLKTSSFPESPPKNFSRRNSSSGSSTLARSGRSAAFLPLRLPDSKLAGKESLDEDEEWWEKVSLGELDAVDGVDRMTAGKPPRRPTTRRRG